MQKTLLTIMMLLVVLPLANAQRPGRGKGGKNNSSSVKGKITGVILDVQNKTPVEFATVVLMSTKGDKQIDGTITDGSGFFRLSKVSLGNYKLVISFLGYEDKYVEDIQLTPKNPDKKLHEIFIDPTGIALDEVTVTGTAALVENKIDKIVFNAEKDVSTTGGDASDVLRKVPLLSVDFEGNVSLRGSSQILVLINGRPSTFFSDNLAEALQTIPADQIKKVEVITQPSAKYDGEGTAGIINIITKKKGAQGFSGSINGSVGTRSNNGSASLSVASGRFGMNLNAGGHFSWPREATSDFYRADFIDGQKRTMTRAGSAESYFLGPRASLSAFYDVNAYNSFSTSASFRGHGGGNSGITHVVYNDPLNELFQEYTIDNDRTRSHQGFDWTTDYRKTFKKPEQELIFAFQLSGDRSNTDNELDQTSDLPELLFKQQFDNNGLNLEKTIQGDFVYPLVKDQVKLEMGTKAVFRDISSQYDYNDFDADTQNYTRDTERSDEFDYAQNVFAGYLSANLKLGENYGMVVGGRFEQTQLSGELVSGKTDPFSNSYQNLLPSLIISRKFKKFRTLKLSYTERIKRPSLRHVNPFVNEEDKRNISYGNPALLPEERKQVELSYNMMIKGVMLNGAVYYKYTNQVIESILTIDEDGVSRSSYQNIGNNSSIGFNFFTSATIARIFTIRGGANLFSYDAEGVIEGVDISRQSFTWNGNINAALDLGKGYKVEVFGFARPRRQTIQGVRPGFSMFSIGAKKEFWDKRASLGIRVVSPFKKYKSFVGTLEGTTFTQETDYTILFRSFGLSFSYRFGKLDFKQRKRKSSINNDDVKSGDSDGNIQ